MNTEQERKYYVDYRESGGVVHSEPTRILPELVFTGRTRPQLDTELEAYAKIVRETLGESNRNGRRIRKTAQKARGDFRNLFIASPGIEEIRDSFYTGWFYTLEEGEIYSAFSNLEPRSPYLKRNLRTPYFLFDINEAAFWNEKIKKNPLTVEEIGVLFSSPDLQSHPSYQRLSRLNLKELVQNISSTADSFLNSYETFDLNDKSDSKREFLRNNLLDLTILQQVHFRSHKEAVREVTKLMEKNQITVLHLGSEGCAVRYGTNPENRRQTRTRTFPIPHNQMKYFQRYGRLGERPMTRTEFETQYRALVDPNTKLQF